MRFNVKRDVREKAIETPAKDTKMIIDLSFLRLRFALCWLFDLQARAYLFEGLLGQRHIDQRKQTVEGQLMDLITSSVDTIVIVVVLRVEYRVPMWIGLARRVIVRSDHFVASHLNRIACDGLLQLLHHAPVHVIVLAAPTPVHRGIAVRTDEVGATKRRHTAEQRRVEKLVVEFIDGYGPAMRMIVHS